MKKILSFLLIIPTISLGIIESLYVLKKDSKIVIIIGNNDIGVDLKSTPATQLDALQYSWLFMRLKECAELDKKTLVILNSSIEQKKEFLHLAQCIKEKFIDVQSHLGTALKLPLFAFTHRNIYKSLHFFHADMRSDFLKTPCKIYEIVNETLLSLSQKYPRRSPSKLIMGKSDFIKKRVALLTQTVSINDYLNDIKDYIFDDRIYKEIEQFFTEKTIHLDESLQDFFLKILQRYGFNGLKECMDILFIPLDKSILSTSFKLHFNEHESDEFNTPFKIISCAQEEVQQLILYAQQEQFKSLYSKSFEPINENFIFKDEICVHQCNRFDIERAFSYILKRCTFNRCNAVERISKSYKRCARCKLVFYCSKKCQLDDWVEHKLFCNPAIHS